VILVKKAIAIIVSVLFVFAITSLSFAAEEKKAAPAPAEKKAAPAKMEEKKAPMAEEKKAPAKAEKKAAAKTKQVTGEVAAVDMKANTITVKGKKAEVTVTCDDKTKVMMGKEKKACADVKVGDKVTVKSAEVDGKNVAKSVSIHAAKPAAEKKMMEKKAEPMKPAAEKPAAKPAEKK
jgi:ribosomal protein S1